MGIKTGTKRALLSGGPAAFSPSQYSGPDLWLKADAGVFQDTVFTTPDAANSDPLGGWQDQSGQGNHFLQATAGIRPLWKTNIQNGLPGILFNGTTNYLKNDAYAANFAGVSTPYSLFLVTTPTNNTGAAAFGVGYSVNTTNLIEHRPRSSGQQQFYRRSNADQILTFGNTLDSACHVHGFLFDSTGVTIDLDGNVLFVAGVTTTTMPVDLCTVGANRRSSSLAGENFLSGYIHEIIRYNRVVTVAEKKQIDSYLKARWNIAPVTPITTFYFQGAPTKYVSNPVLTPLATTDTWDFVKYYHTILRFGATDYRMWYAAATAGGVLGICYATSTDGVTFTKPTLNQVSSGGNTNNNLLHAVGDYGGGVCYDAAGAAGQQFAFLLEVGDGASGGLRLLGSADGITLTILKNIYTSVSPHYEGKCVVKRADGRFAAFYSFGHAAGLRSIGMFLSNTTDPTGTWTDQGAIGDLGATSSTAQFYALMITKYSGVWLGLVPRFNGSTNLVTLDLWQSNNEGANWTQSVANWVPLGTAGAWDSKTHYAGSIVQVGSEWRVYYAGDSHDHADATTDSQIGYAVVTP